MCCCNAVENCKKKSHEDEEDMNQKHKKISAKRLKLENVGNICCAICLLAFAFGL